MTGSSVVSSPSGKHPVKASIRIGTSSQVCSDADLRGEIVIGPRCFVHPKARIYAESGPILIGEGNIIEEQTLIINQADPGEEGSEERPIMSIGANNIFEVGATIQSRKIGDNNIFEPKCFVGRNTVVTSGCSIGALCQVTSFETLPDNCVIFGNRLNRRIAVEKPQSPASQIDFISQIAPKFHHLKKAKVPTPKPGEQKP